MRPEAIEQVEEFKRAFAATGSERVTTHIANLNYLFALLDEEKATLAVAEQRVAELERERDAAIEASESIYDDFKRVLETQEQTFQKWRRAENAAYTFRCHMLGHTAECAKCEQLIAAHHAAGTGKDG